MQWDIHSRIVPRFVDKRDIYLISEKKNKGRGDCALVWFARYSPHRPPSMIGGLTMPYLVAGYLLSVALVVSAAIAALPMVLR